MQFADQDRACRNFDDNLIEETTFEENNYDGVFAFARWETRWKKN
jgi:hypothetical protein